MKTPQLRNGARTQGFTLIELLVVISIIAILAGFALPVFTSAQKKGRITDSLSNVKQVNLALRMYAGDNDGIFPNTTASVGGLAGTALKDGDFSNKAFENLMPKYTTSKKIFANKASKYCQPAPVDNGATDSNLIKAQQNDLLYILGLSDTSDARWPLIATATKDSGGTYVSTTTAKGGVWGGTDAVVGFVDGSARPVSGKEMEIDTKAGTSFIKSPLDATANMLVPIAAWLGTDAHVLVPE